jgi:hypothetical protein
LCTSCHEAHTSLIHFNPRRKMAQKTIQKRKPSKRTLQLKTDRNKRAAELKAERVENDRLEQGWNQSNARYEELIKALKQDKEVLLRENEKLAALDRSPSFASNRSLSMNTPPTTLKQFQTRVAQLEKLIDLLAADQSDLVRALIAIFL